MHHGDLRDAGRGHARLIGKAAPALDEHLRLKEEIGAARFDEAHGRQFVLQCDLLHAQTFFHSHRRRRAALDGAVVGGNHAADAGHVTDAGDAAAALDAGVAVIVVHAETGKRRELEPRRAAVDEQRDALARQKLVAGAEALAPGIGEIPNLLLERAEIPDQRQHLLAVGAKGLGALIGAALNDRHDNSVGQDLGPLRRPAEFSASERAEVAMNLTPRIGEGAVYEYSIA